MRAYVRRQQFGGAAGQAGHVVMLGDPETPVAGRLHSPGDAHRAGHGRRGILAVLDPDEIQHRQRQRLLIGIHLRINAAPASGIPAAGVGRHGRLGVAGRSPRHPVQVEPAS